MKKIKRQVTSRSAGSIASSAAKAPQPLMQVTEEGDSLGARPTDAGMKFFSQFIGCGGGFGPTRDPSRVWMINGKRASEGTEEIAPLARWHAPLDLYTRLMQTYLGVVCPDGDGMTLILVLLASWGRHMALSRALDAPHNAQEAEAARIYTEAMAPLLALFENDSAD